MAKNEMSVHCGNDKAYILKNGDQERVCVFRNKPEEDVIGKDNALKLSSAYNNTYGAGINPEAVKDLLEALKEARIAIIHSGDTGGQTNYDTLEQIKSAIEKAKLPSCTTF